MALIPPVTIEILRTRSGFASDDDTHDADLNMAWETALVMVETYLDRKLAFQADSEFFNYVRRSIRLRRWPVTVGSVQADHVMDGGQFNTIPVRDGQVNYGDGIIYQIAAPCGQLRVEYEGGFQTLPPDLAWAILQVFDQAWLLSEAGGGAQGGIVTVTSGKFTVVGVGSVDTGGTSTGGGIMGSGSDPWGLIPASVVEVLSRYANHAPAGVG